jgi:hypothetical protein
MQHLMTTARKNGFKVDVHRGCGDQHGLRELTHALGFHTVTDPDDSTQVISSIVL